MTRSRSFRHTRSDCCRRSGTDDGTGAIESHAITRAGSIEVTAGNVDRSAGGADVGSKARDDWSVGTNRKRSAASGCAGHCRDCDRSGCRAGGHGRRDLIWS